VDGESKQFMVKRFMIETNTPDKEFGFISEGIGSRLVVATTSETPEVEVELIKNKDKGKVKEVVNLEEIVDIKGWKAIGNRLSQYKITKVNLLEEEEVASEESEADNEATESEDSQSSKKKIGEPEQEPEPETTIEDDGQVSLFGEKPRQESQNSGEKPRLKAEQQS